MRRRHRHRPVGHEGDPRGPDRAHRAGSGGRAARGARPRDAGVRARRPGRHRHAHRARGSHARRRHRVADAEIRAHDRSAPRGRHDHGGWGIREGQRYGEPRALLGDPRRREQLRDRDRLRVPLEPGRPDRARRSDLLADEGLREGPALLPRLDRRRAGRADHDRGAPPSAANFGHPRRAPREARGDGDLLLRRFGRGRSEGHPSDEGVWLTPL